MVKALGHHQDLWLCDLLSDGWHEQPLNEVVEALDEEGKGIEHEYWEQVPLPLCSEVACAIRQTASHKATGPGEVLAELFKAGGETVLDRMHRICVVIWKTGEWPEEWTFSTFFPLPKKGDRKQCANSLLFNVHFFS